MSLTRIVCSKRPGSLIWVRRFLSGPGRYGPGCTRANRPIGVTDCIPGPAPGATDESSEGGEDAPPLKGNDFLRWWYGKPLGELDELIRMDMPADNPGGLNGRQYTDVITYFLRENDYPAGEEPLSEDPEELEEIMIEAEGGGE